MKLSRMIELALVRHYGPEQNQDTFLCNALNSLRHEKMISVNQELKAVQCVEALMLRIWPNEQAYTMVSALYNAGKIKDKDIYTNLPYTTQLYIWWVFDLKNKGL